MGVFSMSQAQSILGHVKQAQRLLGIPLIGNLGIFETGTAPAVV